MCDRCSRSLFRALHLNNSPCSDNPCTPDHLRGTPEPRNFRLLPSVCFCSITTVAAKDAPLTRLYSAGEELSFHRAILFPLFSHVLLHVGPCPRRALLEFLFLPYRYELLGNIFQIQQSTELRCSAAASCPAGVPGHTAPHLAWASRNQSILGHRAVREHSRRRHHLC